MYYTYDVFQQVVGENIATLTVLLDAKRVVLWRLIRKRFGTRTPCVKNRVVQEPAPPVPHPRGAPVRGRTSAAHARADLTAFVSFTTPRLRFPSYSHVQWRDLE